MPGSSSSPAAPLDPAAAAAMQVLADKMTVTMNATLAAQQAAHAAEIAVLRAAIAAVPAPGAGPRPVTERLAVVPDYDGVKAGLEEWFKLMERQFAFYGTAAEADRLRSAAGHLVGPALDWWNLYTAHTVPTTWAQFKDWIVLRFQPVTTVETARTKLLALRQGAGSVNAYVAAFRTLVAVVPTTDAATLRHLFTAGLNPKAREQVAISNITVLEDIISMSVRIGAVAAPANTHAAMDLGALDYASDTDEILDRAGFTPDVLAALDARRANRGSSASASQYSGNGRGAQGASGGYERGAARPPPVIKGLTPQQVKKYMEEGRCFGCNELGHRSGQCPLRRVVDGRVVWKQSAGN